ncbi:hypothetical protein EDB85DRAFT_1532638 [Lactarius pseudohatsudake]|nr:hypothetical protein EDB85DRAFT_1532638 [Lactarius pseudohatsudake]
MGRRSMGKGRKGGQATYLVRPLFAHEWGGARCKSVSCALLRPLLDANGRARGKRGEEEGGREGRRSWEASYALCTPNSAQIGWQATDWEKWGPGENENRVQNRNPVAEAKHVPLTWQAHVPDHPFPLPPLLSSASPGPIRVEKGSQEGTADASALRAAPFVRKKRAHEVSCLPASPSLPPLTAARLHRGVHEGTLLPPSPHRPHCPFPCG